MLRVTWRNLVARKLRLLLSAFAIVLGVAFVAGSLIFSDALNGAFDNIIEGSTADVEVAYKGANDFDSLQDARVLPASLADRLGKLPEVGSVHPSVTNQSTFVIGKNGKVVGGNGPPGLAFNDSGATAITGQKILSLVRGQLPNGTGQVALDDKAAQKAGYKIGDTVKLVTPTEHPTVTATLTGLVEFSNGGTNGATLTIFDLPTMQKLYLGGKNAYTSISLNAADGVSQTELAAAAQKVLPQGVQARTGTSVVAENKKSLDQVLGFLEKFLLAFAGISLVVGIFLIVNTFSILVAQRSRELALLRALGASRRQVNRSVLTEAFVVGLIGSTVGLGAGWLLAQVLKWVFGLIGLDLSRASFPVTWQTVVTSYAVGVVVTVVAGYLPARRASRVAPVAAMRDDVALPEQSLRRRAVVAGVLVVLGAVACVVGLNSDGGSAVSLLLAGFLLLIVGAALLSPLLARPVIRVFGVLYRRLFGSIGGLAEQNAIRNPRRTAVTASALMVGLTLVAMSGILARSISASVDKSINQSLTSQFIISNVAGQPFSTEVAREVSDVEGVDNVAEFRQGIAKVKGETIFVGGVQARSFRQALLIPMAAGSFADLGPGGLVLDYQVAQGEKLKVGDPVTLTFQGGKVPLHVVGIMGKDASSPADWLVSPDTFVKGGLQPLDSYVFVNASPGADLDAVSKSLNHIVRDLPTVTVKDPQAFVDQQKSQINALLYLIYGLLALSVVIAILGVVNTLALSVIERTREVGLLRAIGVSRRQLRTMIRLESIVIAVFGALLGIALGVALGISLMTALKDQGLTELVIPWGLLLLLVVAAALIGIFAAVFPARRAARLDVLRAITTE